MPYLHEDLNFRDAEYAHAYVDEFLNAQIATQIKVLREQRGWSQTELARAAGMKQERISILEDVNYSSWTLSTLRRLARAFDVALSVSFDEFGARLKDFASIRRQKLERRSRLEEISAGPISTLNIAWNGALSQTYQLSDQPSLHHQGANDLAFKIAPQWDVANAQFIDSPAEAPWHQRSRGIGL